MARMNNKMGPPVKIAKYWTGAVGVNQSLVDAVIGECARAVVVGIPGILLLVDLDGTTHTFTAADVVAHNNVLRGQWTQATAAGSTATDIWAWW